MPLRRTLSSPGTAGRGAHPRPDARRASAYAAARRREAAQVGAGRQGERGGERSPALLCNRRAGRRAPQCRTHPAPRRRRAIGARPWRAPTRRSRRTDPPTRPAWPPSERRACGGSDDVRTEAGGQRAPPGLHGSSRRSASPTETPTTMRKVNQSQRISIALGLSSRGRYSNSSMLTPRSVEVSLGGPKCHTSTGQPRHFARPTSTLRRFTRSGDAECRRRGPARRRRTPRRPRGRSRPRRWWSSG